MGKRSPCSVGTSTPSAPLGELGGAKGEWQDPNWSVAKANSFLQQTIERNQWALRQPTGSVWANSTRGSLTCLKWIALGAESDFAIPVLPELHQARTRYLFALSIVHLPSFSLRPSESERTV